MEEIDKGKRLEELRVLMTSKQLKFCEAYLVSLNATKAAKEAHYSEKTAVVMGSENLRKPYIREYIDLRLNDYDVTKSEVLKMVIDRAKSSMNDYMVAKIVKDSRPVQVSLNRRIDEIRLTIRKREMYLERAKGLLLEKEEAAILGEIDHFEKEIIKHQIELDINPDATYTEYEEFEREVPSLDILALARDKENGIIKSFSYTNDGRPKVEMSDSDSAIKLLAQLKNMIVTKVENENNNLNLNVEVTDEEAEAIAKQIFKEIT